METLTGLINIRTCPLTDGGFTRSCKVKLKKDGVLKLPQFLDQTTLNALVREAKTHKHKAFYTQTTHNVYLSPPNLKLGNNHIFNQQVSSSKGCITTDQIPTNSPLKQIYSSHIFRHFLCSILDVTELFEYADPLSSINVHYADTGQELGWHFDNSSFAITLLLQAPKGGGTFQYVRDLRNSEGKDMNFPGVADVLNGKLKPLELKIEPGTLVLFHGRDALHRVTPTVGSLTRILAVFAYNQKPGISLSEEARLTFFGRIK